MQGAAPPSLAEALRRIQVLEAGHMKAETDKQFLQERWEKQLLEVRMRAAMQEQATRMEHERRDAKADADKQLLEQRMTRRFDQMQMQAALDKQALRADAEQRLLEEKMQRARLETQIRELEGKMREQTMLERMGSLERELARMRGSGQGLQLPQN